MQENDFYDLVSRINYSTHNNLSRSFTESGNSSSLLPAPNSTQSHTVSSYIIDCIQRITKQKIYRFRVFSLGIQSQMTGVQIPGLCMSRAVARVCVRSPSQHYKRTESFFKSDEKFEFSSKSNEMSFNCDVSMPEAERGNRVMVVVDSNLEAKSALQWALSHTVQIQDTIVLLHVAKPSKQGVNSDRKRNQKAYELLCSMKNICQTRRPRVRVEIALQECKEKGPIIVEEAKQRNVSLLVLEQRKKSLTWRLQMMWAGKRATNRVVEYCIQNANCMTVAVRRKSRKYGGYLITTKRHKKFWLLA